jgi:hypothetical protein
VTPTPTDTPTPTPTATPYTKGIFTLSIVPPQPGPGQDYQVVVALTPPTAGTLVEVEISGDDGYAYANSATTDENGRVSFGPIPGGAQGVTDIVTASAPELNQQETFVFTF